MIGKVMRGRHVGGLLRYLFGPGKANEHTDPHLVASWDGGPDALEPNRRDDGRPDVRRLADLLNQPLSAATRVPDQPVWHCAVRAAPEDRRLTDTEWRQLARDIVARTGLAPDGDEDGCRWVAVRHADDHIHIVLTLARQDGAPARPSNDFYRVGEACRDAEARLGLTRTGARDRTAARRPTRAESEKAARSSRREPARVVLQREVRTAAAGAMTADEFLGRLTAAGLLVRPRVSPSAPDVVTGYAVALPDDRSADGTPVWFGGGKLAPDLSWPKLAAAWDDAPAATERPEPGGAAQRRPSTPSRRVLPGSGGGRLTGLDRLTAWQDAARLADQAGQEVARLAVMDPAAACDIAHAAGRMLAAAARVVEGRAGGPLTQAADAYDRAARDLYGRTPRRHELGSSLRAVARLVALTGRASRDEATQVLALLANLTALADAVAELRLAQDRLAQAQAARTAAAQLAAVAGGGPTAPPPGETPRPRRVAAAAIHRSATTAVVHRTPRSPTSQPRQTRRVQP